MKATLTIILVIISFSGYSQTTGPQTIAMLEESPAGSKVLRVLRAVNQKIDVDDKFVSTNFSRGLIEKHGEETLKEMVSSGIRDEDGSLTLYNINRPEIFKYELTVNGSKSGWLKMVYHMENQQRYRIKGIETDTIDDPGDVGEPLEF